MGLMVEMRHSGKVSVNIGIESGRDFGLKYASTQFLKVKNIKLFQ